MGGSRQYLWKPTSQLSQTTMFSLSSALLQFSHLSPDFLLPGFPRTRGVEGRITPIPVPASKGGASAILALVSKKSSNSMHEYSVLVHIIKTYRNKSGMAR